MKIFVSWVVLLAVLMALTSCSMFRPVTDVDDTLPPSDIPESSSSEKAEDTNSPTPGTSDTADTSNTHDTTDPTDTTDTPDTEAPDDPEIPVMSASFVGAGDNLIFYGNVRDAASCAVSGGRAYNFAPTYASVKDTIHSADIAFINQESLMCGDGYAFSYYPRFNGPQDLAYDLAETGFDVVNIANNHMLDKGADGLEATIDFLRTVDGVSLIGGYKSQDEYAQPLVLETNGIRIAFLTYTTFTNLAKSPASSPLVIPYPDDDTVASQLARARELADFVIVSVHWGDEYTFTPNASQKSLANLLAENGADVIIGHHPHVIQPVEYIDRPDGKKTLCVYSLGNFVAEQDHDFTMLGGLISFDIVKIGDTTTAENVVFQPTVYYFNTSFYKNHVYFLKDFTEDLAASHGLAYYGKSITVEKVTEYVKNTISSEFLPEYLK